MTRALTPDQRRAVEAAGSDLCVVAGAGTGKTHVLTQRVVHRVRGGTELSRILAVTFTEKAATEMRERLGRALEDVLGADAAEQVEAAAISTIHALCARLLRAHAVEAGVDPQFEVLDEVESDALLRGALARLVAELASERPADLDALAQLSHEPEETLLAVYRAARESGRGLAEFLAPPSGMPTVEELLAELRAALATLADARAGATAAAEARAGAVLLAARGLPREVGDESALAAAVVAVGAAVKLNCGGAVKAALAEVRRVVDARLAPVLAERALAPVREALARAVVRLDELYAAERGSGERLDFAELERQALRLLEERPEVRAAARARWSEVFVDEFQDTNPVQGRLVELLRSDGALFVVGDPKQSIYGFRGSDVAVFAERLRHTVERGGAEGVVALRHSFRSRPEVLGFVNHLFRDGVAVEGVGEDVPPEVHGPLVAGREFAPRDEPCVELFAAACGSADDGRDLEARWIAHRVRALVEGGRDSEGRAVEPLRVAAPTPEDPLATRPAGYGDVAVLVRATTGVKLLERALTARDVPYLVVKGRGFFHAREVVDLANLLATVDNPRDDLTLAAVLRSPACGLSDDALFCLAAERGRAAGREALADVLADWEASSCDVAGLEPAEGEALRRFLRAFGELREARSEEPLSGVVDLALRTTGLESLALARPNGRQRAANLRKVRALARAMDDSSEGSLRRLVERMRDLRAREVRETEAPVAGAARGAVSILTVHAAKGLEFPVVFVPDLGRGTLAPRGTVSHSARDGIGLRCLPPGHPLEHVTPNAHAEITARNAEREAREADRLLYVAATRAAEHLVLTASHPPRRHGQPLWWERAERMLGLDPYPAEGAELDLGPGASDGAAPRVRLRVHPPALPADLPPMGTRTLLHEAAPALARGEVPSRRVAPEAEREAERLVAEASRRVPAEDGTLYQATVSAVVTFARCPQEFRLRHVLGLPESLELAPPAEATAFDEAIDEQGRSGPVPAAELGGHDDEWGVPVDARARGRAAHVALERLVPGGSSADAARVVSDALRLETGGAPPDPAEAARVTQWVRGFLESALAREAADLPRPRVRREQALLFRAGRTGIRGQMDLVLHAPRGFVVVDYKASDLLAASPEYALHEYALQMRLYALGLEAVTGTPPARLVLFSLPRAREVEVACGPAELRDARALLDEFQSRTRDRDFEPGAAPPCARCAYRAVCAYALPEAEEVE